MADQLLYAKTSGALLFNPKDGALLYEGPEKPRGVQRVIEIVFSAVKYTCKTFEVEHGLSFSVSCEATNGAAVDNIVLSATGAQIYLKQPKDTAFEARIQVNDTSECEAFWESAEVTYAVICEARGERTHRLEGIKLGREKCGASEMCAVKYNARGKVTAIENLGIVEEADLGYLEQACKEHYGYDMEVVKQNIKVGEDGKKSFVAPSEEV